MPVGAVADVINPDSNGMVALDGVNGGVISATNAIGIKTTNGFTVGNMVVGAQDAGAMYPNDLYVLNSVLTDEFTVLVGADAEVSINALLSVLDNKQLVFKGSDSVSSLYDLNVGGICVGDSTTGGALKIESVDSLTVNGAISAYDDFNVNATGGVVADSVAVYSGDFNVTTENAGVDFEDFVVSGAGNVLVNSGANLTVAGAVQNISSDSMILRANANITVGGALDNMSANDMTIESGGALNVTGAMTNSSQSATMTINAGSWTVNGGSGTDASLVVKGNLYASVEGLTKFANGINLNGMSTSNVFSLETDKLDFGAGTGTQSWYSLFSNSLDLFNMAIKGGDLNLKTVFNGSNLNFDASMSLLAQNIYATDVNNSGDSLIINAIATDGGQINLSGSVVGAQNSDTDLVASGTLNVAQDVSNSGSMLLSAPKITLNTVSNVGNGLSYANLDITSSFGENGKIVVAGNLINKNGNMTIAGKDLSVGGIIENNGGQLTLKGSDTSGMALSLNGAVNVLGGTVNLNALAGDIDVGGALYVSNGILNLDSSVRNLVVNNSVHLQGNLVVAEQTGLVGDMTVATTGTNAFNLSGTSITAGGIVVGEAGDYRNVVLDSSSITVNKNVNVYDNAKLVLGKTAQGGVDVGGQVFVDKQGILDVSANNFTVGSMKVDGKYVAHGSGVVADNGDIHIDGGLYFDGDNTNVGLMVDVESVDKFSLSAQKNGAIVSVGAINVAEDKALSINSAGAVSVAGTVYNLGDVSLVAAGNLTVGGSVTNMGDLNVSAAVIDMQGINNASDKEVFVSAEKGSAKINTISNTGGALTINAADAIVAVSVSNTDGGVLSLNAEKLNAQSLVVDGNTGTQLDLNVSEVVIDGNMNVVGDLVQGAATLDTGILKHNVNSFSVANLLVDGNVVANVGNTTYSVGNTLDFGGDITVAKDATASFSAGNLINTANSNVYNSGELTLASARGFDVMGVVNNSGVLTMDSGSETLGMDSLSVNSGNVVLRGAGLDLDSVLKTKAMLYQDYAGVLSDKDINVQANNYVLTVKGLDLKGIDQDGSLIVYTSDVNIGTAGVNAMDLRLIAQKDDMGQTIFQNVRVEGSVSGNVDFIGLEKMDVFGNYTFNDNSSISAAVLPYAQGGETEATDIDYWATVSLEEDETLGQITNPTGDNSRALISVGGVFQTNLNLVDGLGNTAVSDANIGINLFDIVDAGKAIWLLHADEGIDNLASKIRNLNVQFCNADGSVCYNYYDTLVQQGSNNTEDLPIYISERDSNGDSKLDSLYVVFDSRFGGPVEVFKIQPIVGRQPEYTLGEYVSAGAIDDMVAGQLANKRFYNRTPIELIPVVFKGTNLSKVATELYNRMEEYVGNHDGSLFVPFSRLFQVRELELIAGAVALNEHTAFRSFEDRMLDEFIWNRGRKLKKAWLDMDYGMYFQNVADGKHADGNRFSLSGGFDWQATNTLMLGLTGRISHTSSGVSDVMDLSYGTILEDGFVDVDVANTNIGLGAYLMETVNEKARIYGNAFLDVHVFDVKRSQNFVAPIDGSGTAFALTTEWGLMHDILNQYIVGNLYARAGYNFGFGVTEEAAGSDYMKLKSDGYFIFTPGYSLMAQKRIYPSAWFQMRPYASIGVEYDVLGMPDDAKYKFAVADKYTYYDIETNPLWANIGAGVEFLAANGVQIGVDYRYQYNSAIQLHNIKISGSYRF